MSLLSLGASVAGHFGLLNTYSLVRRQFTKSQVAILMYHHVSSESPPWLPGAVASNDFEREIAHLCKVTRIVPLDWLVNQLYQGKDIPSKAVCITFDDGYKDNYTTAYHILRKYNAPATIFLTPGYIESSKTFWDCKIRFAVWNTSITQLEVEGFGYYYLKSPKDRLKSMAKIITGLMKLPEREKNRSIEKLLQALDVVIPSKFGEKFMLTWNDISDMSENGISFGAHTVTHPILTKLSIEEAREEIVRSKKDIEKRVGAPCTLFAYPNGDFNTEIIELVKKSGFKGAVTTIPHLISQDEKLFMLSRISAGPDFYTFKGSLSGLYSDLMTALNRFKRR